MTNDTPETGTSIILAPGTSLESLLSIDKGLDFVLDQIERDARAEVADLTTPKGRKAVASLAYRVAQSKSALDAAGKAMNAEARKKIDVVDAQRRAARERLDTLRDEIRDPLTAWETADEKRIADHKLAMGAFYLHRVTAMNTVEKIQEVVNDAQTASVRNWEEFADEADAMAGPAFDKFKSDLEAAKERERQAEELASLKADAEARQIADDERERQAVLERDRIAQEEADRIEAKRVEDERVEAERVAAEKAQADKLAAAQAEKERAEREARAIDEARQEAIENARRDKAEAEERHNSELRAADERLKAVAQAERDRVAKAKEDEDKARAKREADKKHMFRIRGEITKALEHYAGPRMEDIAQAIIDGKIPHVTATI
jgi:colicin import membrane protein